MSLSLSLEFLTKLVQNNNKPWFDANKAQYQEARAEFVAFVEKLIPEIQKFDPAINLSAKDCIFRINRDLRFSKDKRPYKNHFGAYIAQGGRKSILAGYYIHVEPADGEFLSNSLWAGGIYCPEPKTLLAIRNDIYDYTEEYKELINNPAFAEKFSWLDGKLLRTAPKGFPKDFPEIDLLKRREYSFGKLIDKKTLCSEQLFEHTIETFIAMKPLNDFLNRAILFHQEQQQ